MRLRLQKASTESKIASRASSRVEEVEVVEPLGLQRIEEALGCGHELLAPAGGSARSIAAAKPGPLGGSRESSAPGGTQAAPGSTVGLRVHTRVTLDEMPNVLAERVNHKTTVSFGSPAIFNIPLPLIFKRLARWLRAARGVTPRCSRTPA
jgi:hypothetical protein